MAKTLFRKKSLKIAGDFIYTVMASVVLNIALQIIIYPLITKLRGEAAAGNILTFIGFVYIIPQALGSALSSGRLVLRKQCDTSNADFSHIILLFSLASLLSVGIFGYLHTPSVVFALFYGLFAILYMLRAYAQVEFRLTLKFKTFFYYYCLVSIGYLIGFGLYLLTDVWLLIFICGEALALFYSFFRGTIFKKDAPLAPRSAVNKAVGAITLSLLVRDCVLQFDKVVLWATIDPASVTKYNAVSIIAKTMQMLTQPINTLILSYLTVKDTVLSKKDLLKFSGIACAVSGFFYAMCIIGTPIFLKLFYADLYSKVIPYNLLVNLGIILGFLATLFMSVVLSQGRSNTFSAFECIFGALYVGVSYYCCMHFALWGLVYATLFINIAKVICSFLLLFTAKNTVSYTKS